MVRRRYTECRKRFTPSVRAREHQRVCGRGQSSVQRSAKCADCCPGWAKRRPSAGRTRLLQERFYVAGTARPGDERPCAHHGRRGAPIRSEARGRHRGLRERCDGIRCSQAPLPWTLNEPGARRSTHAGPRMSERRIQCRGADSGPRLRVPDGLSMLSVPRGERSTQLTAPRGTCSRPRSATRPTGHRCF
jgi:hypothetical protein